MSKIKFLAEKDKVYDGDFNQIGKNQVRLVFKGEIPSKKVLLSGFNLVNEHNGIVQTPREDYKYLYRTYEDNPNTVELCNDNIPWVAPPEPEPIPEPEPYVPTFEEVRYNKIEELSMICKNTIEAGLVINDQQYSYKYDDQLNLDKILNLVKVTGLPLGYHADDQGHAEHSAEELIDIYMQLAMNQYSQQTYFNQSKQYLLSLEESDENKEYISEYVYGTELEGEYLENYNHMMSLYQNQVEALAGIESQKAGE